MYYMVYETRNLVNGKVYVGQHSTHDLNDSYLGSGLHLKRAIAKYGRDNFVRTVLFVYDNPSDMADKEREIVNTAFCQRADTYNITEGGTGGFGYINRTGINNSKKNLAEIAEKVAQKNRGVRRENISQILRQQHALGLRPIIQQRDAGWSHSNETREKMSLSQKGKMVGTKNGSHGSRWMHHPETGPQRVPAELIESYLSEGFQFGRKPDEAKVWRNKDGSLRS